MTENPIKKTDSGKSAFFDINNKGDSILRLERLKRNSIQLFNAGYIPRDWLVSIAVIIAGARA
ncbi:hypothetical protein [Polynucleobacter asymbioticus]|jgi:hypothetical protein|uniref:Uncharacterized protein n=1 Tax=Polynucleobacter asymbioticus TaxID=576611 RepID=A0AAC9IS33_9BURK|nr:hypothetical protein [Polynucleobacter asymbioticus]APB98823.1 hypothetical protein A4F89_05520 [Polynucleobacter asymbioticus]APC01126.1 hypothetical protein AOC25_05615 [Polynucleobacter asymbioticus]